jgi:TonB family protein
MRARKFTSWAQGLRAQSVALVTLLIVTCFVCCGTASWAQTSAVPESSTIPTPSGPVRITPGVIAGNLAGIVNPVYPAEAKALHVQGVVVLHAIISKTGDIEDLRVVSGPDLIRQSAIDAVRRWKYRPYMLNGEPTEVETTINVNFTFGGGGKNAPPAPLPNPQVGVMGSGRPFPPPEPMHVASGTMASMLIGKVDPVFPAGVSASGSVILCVVVSKAGTVDDVQVLSGPRELAPSVIDSVKQWTYKPYLLNGEPTDVQTTVVAQFTSGSTVDITSPSGYPELSDQQLMDQASAAMKDSNDESAVLLLDTLLERHPYVSDKDHPVSMEPETQTLLEQASLRVSGLQMKERYYLDTGARVDRVGKSVTSPVVIYQVQPELTAESKQQKFKGTVLINLIVDQQGLPRNVHVLRGVGMGLDEKAVAAVSQYKFKPAMQDGIPVPVELNVEVNFQIF